MSVNQDKRQQDDSLEDSNIWNTDRINEILRKADEEGLDFKSVDNPFHDNNPEFKRANILFEYTKDELLEIQKCAQDESIFQNIVRL